jgi:hypothetical protein
MKYSRLILVFDVESNGRSSAERARERKLRDDPMADVEGPTLVGCRLCGKKIKLSPKSSYDLFHWQTHKGRCLRKAAKSSKLAPRTLQLEVSSATAIIAIIIRWQTYYCAITAEPT